jgi:hypothetical protein
MAEVAAGCSREMSEREAPQESVPAIAERIAALDWPCIAAHLDADGYAVIGSVLSPEGSSPLVPVKWLGSRRGTSAGWGLRCW